VTLDLRYCSQEIASAQRVLIVGGDSTIGSALNKRLLGEGYQVTYSTRRTGIQGEHFIYLDLRDRSTFLSVIGHHFDTAVLCGSVTSIEKCEENPEITRQVNVDGTLALASLLRDSGCHLVFISTNMVFDGSKTHVQASDAACPVTEYGRQKVAVEEALLTPFYQASIIRFGKIVPAGFPLFSEWLQRLRAGYHIYPYHDRNMAPISLAFATDILVWLITQKRNGIFQVTADSEITYADAAYRIACFIHADTSLIEPSKSTSGLCISGKKLPIPAHTSLQFSTEFEPYFNAPPPDEALRYFVG